MEINKNKNWYKIKSLIPNRLFEPLLGTFYKIQSIGYRGNKFFCPVCEVKLRKFKKKCCPKCGSSVRHRALWLFLSKRTNFFKRKMDVLHFAPEHCFYDRFKKLKNLSYLSADLGSPRAMAKVDMTNIQFNNETFDVVLSSHVLEHIDDDLKAMKELCRVQKKDGWSVHLVPIDSSRKTTYQDPALTSPQERLEVYGHHDHKRIYGRDYKNRLEESGFNVKIFKAEDFCDPSEISRTGIKNGTEIYYCTK
jgi:SAM-dependent methyltransferase